ncbi:MAG: M48 family metallopeptidase [Candidatus Harrisonbacteria bacterium]|nr:M48 family metallopeptidase [Candidatus Harrisonbacteria bacterium]
MSNVSLYTHRDANIRKTWTIFTLFFVVVIGIGWVFTRMYGDPSILVIAVVFSTVMSIVSYWYSDKIVLAMSHAHPVNRESARELYDVVENLCITAGLPVPRIYIIDEPAPNAFAAGRNPEHAVVAVTRGLLERLDRAELEGVLSHELSHIGNRDMLVSTVIVILVGFISILGDMFLRSMFWGGMRRRSDRGSAGGVLLLLGIVLSVLAPIAATLMQLAISRKRELLADASGALLTRYPEGLARALEKIHADATPLRVAQNTTAHLWFDDPFTKKRTPLIHKLFMTHPPVAERVKALRGMKL